MRPNADSVGHHLFPEEMKFKNPTLEQMRELERAWVEASPDRRLETVAAKAAELGVEIESMHRYGLPPTASLETES